MMNFPEKIVTILKWRPGSLTGIRSQMFKALSTLVRNQRRNVSFIHRVNIWLFLPMCAAGVIGSKNLVISDRTITLPDTFIIQFRTELHLAKHVDELNNFQ